MTDAARETSPAVAVTIDGRPIEARKGELVIDAAERHGVYIPRFCYHPRMRSVGMCRMCIVDIDTGRGPSLQPSCMIECADGMVVATESAATKKAQEGVLEFLLINHPLDCPVCDKGGECPLQDQTMSYGPGESRFVEEKRHFEKPIPVSDLVLLDRERCILCDRCTRFAKEVAGDPLIHFLDRGNETQVNTFPGDPFASYFSGNTVQICPVGALTATPYRFKARPWDLEQTPSTCTSCSVGCRVVVQSSRNKVLRYQGADIDPVNWGWLCDKGRFDFEAVNSSERLGDPLLRDEGLLLKAATWSEAMDRAAQAVRDGLNTNGPAGLAVLGGARLTNESAYAWTKLTKGLLGSDNLDAQMADGLPAEVVLGLPRTTIDEACQPGGTVLLLGADPKEELPVLFLRLRHAVINDGVKIVELSPVGTGVSPLATVSLRYRSGEVTSLVRSLILGGSDRVVAGVEPELIKQAAALLKDRPVTALLGRTSLAESAAPVAVAATTLHETRPEVRFLSGLRRANIHGALEMGMAPGLLPGRVTLDAGRAWFGEHWGSVPAQPGLDAAGILKAAADGRIDTLVLVGADPLADFPDRSLAERGLAGARTVIAVDQFLSESVKQADIVLPAAGYAEVAGTTINLEGRVSTLSQKVTPPGTAQPDWVVAADLADRLGHDLGVESPEQIWKEIEAVAPVFAGLTQDRLRSPAAREGVVVPLPSPPEGAGGAAGDVEAGATGPTGEATEAGEGEPAAEAPAVAPPEPRVPLPDRTVIAPSRIEDESLRLVVNRKLYDRGTLVQSSPSLADLGGPATLRLNPDDFERLGVAPGAEVRVTSGRGHVTVPAVPDPTVPRQVAVLPANGAGGRASVLVDSTVPVTDVRVELP